MLINLDHAVNKLAWCVDGPSVRKCSVACETHLSPDIGHKVQRTMYRPMCVQTQTLVAAISERMPNCDED